MQTAGSVTSTHFTHSTFISTPAALPVSNSTLSRAVFVNMDGTSQPDPASGSTTPISAQEQARLRRERRNAKIMAGGSARMNKITSMSGRPLAAEACMSFPKGIIKNATKTKGKFEHCILTTGAGYTQLQYNPPQNHPQQHLRLPPPAAQYLSLSPLRPTMIPKK